MTWQEIFTFSLRISVHSFSDNLISGSRVLKRFILYAGIWGISAFVYALITHLSNFNLNAGPAVQPTPVSEDNDSAGLGAWGLVLTDGTSQKKPVLSLYMDEIELMSGRIGMYSTGLYSAARINGLNVISYNYTETGTPTKNSKGRSKVSPAAKPVFSKTIDPVKALTGTSVFQSRLIGPFKLEPAFDIENFGAIAKFNIYNLNFTELLDSRPVLKLSSLRAENSFDDEQVLLRGNVIIETSGKTLRTNFVKWDRKAELFTIEGPYFIENSSGDITYGANQCLDSNLNQLNNHQAKK